MRWFREVKPCATIDCCSFDWKNGGKIRLSKVLYKKGDKIVKEESTIEYNNGHYWTSVPTEISTRTWNEEGKYFECDDSRIN